ncbi:MAG: hypothetical protein KFF77_08025 [Bacteroidetes bacterium]|nr:hypothetical protein [Bacteroidota bacterium]
MRIDGLFSRVHVIVLSVLLFALPLLLAGCGGDDDTPTGPTTFGLLITNKMPHDYDVWQKPSSAGDAFAKVGVAPSGATYRINPLDIGTTYTFRLSRAGTGPAAFDFEHTVTSSSGDVTWEVK